MCGICGLIGPAPRPDDDRLLATMTSSLAHRGPDSQGFYASPDGRCRLGMRRLAIIDPDGGAQPMHQDGSWLVYNGEVYNYQAFSRARSDTAAVLELYREHGDRFLEKLRGMFALALYDQSRGRLLLARDRYGIKPLFYTVHQGRLLFASEIKALLQAGVPRRLNQAGLYQHLSFLYVPPPETMFEGIFQLPPGHRLTWENGRLTQERFPLDPPARLPGNLWEALLETVQAHLVADTPVGVFLSGGLDSSALALAVRELGYPLSTFSIGFQGAGLYDESGHARSVALLLGAEHHEESLSSECVLELPAILSALDEPMADASVLPNFQLARLASRRVKVALSGTGGDELLGGYRRYSAHRWAGWARLLTPGWVRALLRALPAGGDTRLRNGVRLAQKFLLCLHESPERRYLAWNQGLDEEQKVRLLCRLSFAWPPSHELCRAFFPHGGDVVQQAMDADLSTYLPGDLLTLTDRMSMAHSLEVRVPFVDPVFAGFAATLPSSEKAGLLSTKRALRRVLAGRLPRALVQRPKQGFGTPVDLWLRRELKSLADRLLGPEAVAARGLFRPAEVTALYRRHLAGQDQSARLWPLLMVELWHRMVLDRMPSGQPRTLAEVL